MQHTLIAIVFLAATVGQARAMTVRQAYNRYVSFPTVLLSAATAVFRDAAHVPLSSVLELQDEDETPQVKVLKRKLLRKKLDGYLKRPKSSYIRFG
ncbi:hypothetical protein AAVH_22932 [Aphelenchoides avenae]|nr:hypothetical protein AAVH_22932 [Aphelenchus avenae]